MRQKNQKIQPFETAHTIARINNREFLLKDQIIKLFQSFIFSIFPRYGATIYCFIVMTNHIHLLHQSPTKNPDTKYGKKMERNKKLIEIGDLKRHLFSQFAKAANKIIKVDKLGKVIEDIKNLNGKFRERFGCLIEDRSKSIPVRDENHGLANLIYIFLNAVRAGIVKHPKEYEYSNYNMYASGLAIPGFSFHPEYLALGNTLDEAARVFTGMIEEAVAEILQTFENTNYITNPLHSPTKMIDISKEVNE